MPKPGMTRTEELVHTGFGSTGGALFGSAGDIVMAFVGAVAAGFVGIAVPILSMTHFSISWFPGGDQMFQTIMNNVSDVASSLISGFAYGIIGTLFNSLGITPATGSTNATTTTTAATNATNTTTPMIVSGIFKFAAAPVAVVEAAAKEFRKRRVRIRVDLTRIAAISRGVKGRS